MTPVAETRLPGSVLAAPSSRRGYEAAKRIFDLVVALPALVVLSPLLAGLAVAVRATSAGPILYRGERIGRHGRPFRILKFRTMVADADRYGSTTALADARITRPGVVMRRLKLDELPQLWNVVTGEMSLVGPRPEVEEHTREYDAAEQAILTVRPGITDYSSIRFVDLAAELGSENAHEVFVTRVRAEKNRLRLRYVQNQSFTEDLRILLRTLAVLIRKAL